LPTGRFPAGVLWLGAPPDRLDVNVHPTKREVRFADGDAVFSLVAAACAQPLAAIHPPFAVVGAGAVETSPWPEQVREGPASPPAAQMPLLLPVAGGDPRADAAPPAPSPLEAALAPPAAASDGAAVEPEIWQLHRTYILAPVRGGLVIVDQHAAHERILYEDALRRLRGAQGASQGLLFPVLVDLSQSQCDRLLEVEPYLKQLGWNLAPLSPPTVVIQGIPSGLQVEHPGRLLVDVLDGLGEGASSAHDQLLERVASSHACHTAIRA